MIPGSATADKTGRWRLNAGSEMVVEVAGLNEGKPIRLVLDLKTCKAKNAKITTLIDHDTANVAGYWDGLTFEEQEICGDLHLMQLKDDAEAAAMPDVVRTHAMIRNGVPIQVSVGADAGENGEWEEVKGKIKINGREYDGAGEMPLYVLRNGELFESSIVTFGADAKTGRLAAKQITKPVVKGTTMSDMLKVLLGKFPEKHHGLVARCVAEGKDESNTTTDITAKIHASDMAERDEYVTALEKDRDELKAKLAEYESKKDDDKDEDDKKVAATKGSTKGIKFGGEKKGEETKVVAKTLSQGMKIIAAENPKLTGFALRRAARARFPDAEEK